MTTTTSSFEPTLQQARHGFLTHAAMSLFSLGLGLSAASAHAGLLDAVKTRTESRETLLVYDLAGFTSGSKELLDVVRRAVTYQGDNAFVRENALATEVPAVPGKLTLKGMRMPLVQTMIQIPVCDGALFTVASSDNSLANIGDRAQYMACGFNYMGGVRVNFYASYSTTSGGVSGLLSGKTLAKVVTGAVGLKTDPQDFINTSIAKLEEYMSARGWGFAIVEMAPAIEGKVLAKDPLDELKLAQAGAAKKAEQRSQRLAARAELRKLGYDAADLAQFRKAIATGDDDIVELFIDAGAIDPAAADETGKPLTEYATKPSVKVLLARR